MAVAGAAVIMVAGPATADPGLTIDGPLPVQVGTSHWVTSDLHDNSGETMMPSLTGSAGNYVYLYDNGQCVTSDIIGMNGTGLKSMLWTPMTAGTHTLQFRFGWSVKTMTVTVEPAPPGAPAPSPWRGCGSTGSIG
ncbi:hypothetical protein AB0I25_09110 [Nocardia tengchongensis]|uniref:hypothetical protein n=1 Tax=Nocardia tengchongensis TaxID=2055889 RepID=UPI0033FF9819